MIQNAVGQALRKHEDKMQVFLREEFKQLEGTFKSAFPDGDPHGHRLAHEYQIKQAHGWDKLKAEVITKFLSGGLWVAAGWLAYAVWRAFKDGLNQ